MFVEDSKLLQAWRGHAIKKDDLKVRVGRWNIPGKPIAILVDFTPFYKDKNEIYTQAWIDFQVDSLHAYGDYDEASMFSYAAGKVVESFYRYNLTMSDKVIYQAHEWMTGLGALYLQNTFLKLLQSSLRTLLLSGVPLQEITNLSMITCLLITVTKCPVN